jgi:Predicted transcriptional regulators
MNGLKRLRNKQKLTQEYIAQCVNVTPATYSRWESGEFFPRADKLPALAKILKCTVDELLCKDTA